MGTRQTLWEQALEVARATPGVVADSLDRWLMRQHSPIPFDHGETARCWSCRKEWPCEEFTDAVGRVDGRRAEARG